MDIHRWRREVGQRTPDIGSDGKLAAPIAVTPLEGFEEVTPHGTYAVDLLTTNWNRRDKARFDASFYGEWQGRATRRIPATRVVENLRKAGGGQKMQDALGLIVHPGLRKTLLDAWGDSGDVVAVETALVKWLQQSTLAGLVGRAEPTNPAARARWRELREFCDDPSPNPLHVPAVVGIRWVDARGYEMVERVSEGRTTQRLEPTANVMEKIVAYIAGDDELPDRTKHTIFDVYQNWKVKPSAGRVAGLQPIPEGSLLAEGRKLGEGQNLSEYRRAWEEALDAYLADAGFIEFHRLRQGCVIEREDGSRRFIRNFKRGKDKMGRVGFKPGWCKDIKRVYRSPYVMWMLDRARRAV